MVLADVFDGTPCCELKLRFWKGQVLRRSLATRCGLQSLASRAAIDHAVLAVRHDERWLILDNRWNALRQDKELEQFKPLFIVERHGVSLLSKIFRLDGKPIEPRSP